MTPANDFAALVNKLESEIDNVLATECIYGVLSQESGVARSQRDDARAALLAYGAGVERERNDIARWVMQLRELKQWERKDHACAQCDGTLVIEGFVCAYHIAERVALATRPTEARDA